MKRLQKYKTHTQNSDSLLKKLDAVVYICNLTTPSRREMPQTDESLESSRPSRLAHRAEIQQRGNNSEKSRKTEVVF